MNLERLSNWSGRFTLKEALQAIHFNLNNCLEYAFLVSMNKDWLGKVVQPSRFLIISKV